MGSSSTRKLLSGMAWLALLLVVLAGAGAVLLNTWRRPGQGFADEVALQQCAAAYARARGAADTAATDRMRPIISRGQAARALTCRVMRERGWLPPDAR